VGLNCAVMAYLAEQEQRRREYEESLKRIRAKKAPNAFKCDGGECDE